jgi:hypothetical protein
VKTFHGFEEDPSSGCSEPGSPCRVFGIVITTGEEALAKGVVVRVEVRRRNNRSRREIDR